MLTPNDVINAVSLIELGAKTASADKPLRESCEIQQVALNIITKIQALEAIEAHIPRKRSPAAKRHGVRL